MLEEQKRAQREDIEALTNELERLRIEKVLSRGKVTERLPKYDGTNLDIDEWQEKVEAILKLNGWNISQLLGVLPTSLSCQAKRAFDSLLEEEKSSKDVLFQIMKKKLDPQAKQRNKELFMHAKRGATESVVRFIDRLKMYIRRWGEDPTDDFATEMLKFKCYQCLNQVDQKVLRAAVDHNENLDKIVKKADSLISQETRQIGMVGFTRDDCAVSGQWGGEYSVANAYEGCGELINSGDQSGPLPTCWNCGEKGHRYWECYQSTQPLWDQEFQNHGLTNCQYNNPIQDHEQTNTANMITEAQIMSEPVVARNQGQGLPQIVGGGIEDETPETFLTEVFSPS